MATATFAPPLGLRPLPVPPPPVFVPPPPGAPVLAVPPPPPSHNGSHVPPPPAGYVKVTLTPTPTIPPPPPLTWTDIGIQPPPDKFFSPLTLDALNATMIKAVTKHGQNTPLNPGMLNGERLAILVEEVGEVAKCLTYDHNTDVDNLVTELLQVAAMACAWVEAIDVLDDP